MQESDQKPGMLIDHKLGMCLVYCPVHILFKFSSIYVAPSVEIILLWLILMGEDLLKG